MPAPAPGGSSSSSSTSTVSASGVDGPVQSADTEEPLQKYIERLRLEKRAIKEQRKLVQRTLKNAEKRKSRLKKKARQLSNKDLLDVLQLREDANARKTQAETAAAPQATETPEVAPPAS